MTAVTGEQQAVCSRLVSTATRLDAVEAGVSVDSADGPIWVLETAPASPERGKERSGVIHEHWPRRTLLFLNVGRLY